MLRWIFIETDHSDIHYINLTEYMGRSLPVIDTITDHFVLVSVKTRPLVQPQVKTMLRWIFVERDHGDVHYINLYEYMGHYLPVIDTITNHFILVSVNTRPLVQPQVKTMLRWNFVETDHGDVHYT